MKKIILICIALLLLTACQKNESVITSGSLDFTQSETQYTEQNDLTNSENIQSENSEKPESSSNSEVVESSVSSDTKPKQEQSDTSSENSMQSSESSVNNQNKEPSSNIPMSENKAEKRDKEFWAIREDMVNNVKKFKKTNPDTVGWLYLYDTTVNSPVFFKENDNEYYLKHNDYKENDVNGALFADYNCTFGGRDIQSDNLIIYGHSKDENPDGGVEKSREYEHFTELKRWQNIDFCKSHPYFLFATEDESMVFEVFAAFHTKTSFIYNNANPTLQEQKAIIEEAKKKSLFDFNVDVEEGDKIMTLSTCCRRIVPTYPNGYRFVIMGRLVEKGKLLNWERTVTENPTALTVNNIYE